ncbi:Hypothetical predicted protein [Olea europaea subsp. europaea]|uniref:Uncharacterized protein n=1 Tax=Olea europaea subsp. europaea TaxID=158383 RepID=A0A8S0V916_OLEEU|nr:Hypothetical predicted protein [Olea europaea subsp. europaea]
MGRRHWRRLLLLQSQSHGGRRRSRWRQSGQAETEAGTERWPVAVGELSLLCAVLQWWETGSGSQRRLCERRELRERYTVEAVKQGRNCLSFDYFDF